AGSGTSRCPCRSLPGPADLASQPDVTRRAPVAAPCLPWPGSAQSLCQGVAAPCRALPGEPGKNACANCRVLPGPARLDPILPRLPAAPGEGPGKLGSE